MSGFGIREQYELMKSYGSDIHWREESFLQQLSLNGSMLWMANHNQHWLLICGELLGRPNTGWTTLREVFQAYPAGLTRRILYQASFQYYKQLSVAYQNFSTASFLASGERNAAVKNIEKELERITLQLKELKWCALDRSSGQIKILKALPPSKN